MKKYIGDKAFYKAALLIAMPIMIQNGITNFVGMLDNIMIGQVGTVQMTGVAVANQLMFVFNLCIFGAISGAGIFTAQYYGTKDAEGVRYTLRFKVYICLLLTIIGMLVFLFFGDQLIQLYLQGDGSASDAAASLKYGREYMNIMMIGMIPFALSQTYAGTLRETDETILPMKAGLIAVFVNLALNYVLIFGHFGFPAMGVAGAAIATVISRFAELLIVYIGAVKQVERFTYLKGLWKSFYIPGNLFWKICRTGLPLLINEALWAAGMATQSQCYSLRGLDVVAAVNIQSTLWNVFSVSFMAMGNAIGIMVGQILGTGDIDKAKDTDRKLIAFSVATSFGFAILLGIAANFFPQMYNTTDSVRALATSFIFINAILMPMEAYLGGAYFTMRAGGKTFVTFLFDGGFMWIATIPLAYTLSRYTTLPIVPLFFCCQGINAVKAIIGFFMLKKGMWIQTLVGTPELSD